MIKIKLSEQLGNRRMSRRELAQLIRVRPNTIGDMYNDNVKRLDITTLNKICMARRLVVIFLIFWNSLEMRRWNRNEKCDKFILLIRNW